MRIAFVKLKMATLKEPWGLCRIIGSAVLYTYCWTYVVTKPLLISESLHILRGGGGGGGGIGIGCWMKQEPPPQINLHVVLGA